MSGSTLTDRYVWAVVRSLPEEKRADVERELRGLVGDHAEARSAAGADEETAEREAIVELGDPDRLVVGYADRTPYLVGPAVFPAYVRLLRTLAPIVLPIALIAGGLGPFIEHADIGKIIAGGWVALMTAGLHLFFWVTLSFAFIDRIGGSVSRPGHVWTPDQLPEVPDRSPHRVTLPETVAGLVILAIGVALIFVQRSRSAFADGAGDPIPVLDPGLWSLWIPVILGLAVAQAVFSVVLWRRGRWTYGAAAVQAVLQLAFAVVACYLLATGALFNPAFVDRLPDVDDWGRIVVAITFVSIAASSLWGAYDAFRRARRTHQAA